MARPPWLKCTLVVSGAGRDSHRRPRARCRLQQPALLQHIPHRRERKLAQQLPQARLALMQIVVVTEAREPLYFESRLLRVDFPRMQVERKRLASLLIDLP